MKPLVRLPNWLGDTVMATPFLSALGSLCEECGLGVWGADTSLDLLQQFPRVSRFHRFVKENDKSDLSDVVNEKYTHLFLLTNSFSSAREGKRTGIPNRIGYRRDWRATFLTQPVPCGTGVRKLPMVEYYLNLLGDFGAPTEVSPVPTLYLDQSEVMAVRKTLQTVLPVTDSSASLVVVAPGAAHGSAKQWPVDLMRVAAEQLVHEGSRLVVVGAQFDHESGEIIGHNLPQGAWINLAGKTTIRELMACLSLADCVICNDSGAMHIATAVRTPVVVLFGPTDPSHTGPRGLHHQVLACEIPCGPCFLRECPLDHACMVSHSPASVVNAVQRVFSQRESAH